MVPFSGKSTSHWAKRVYAVFVSFPLAGTLDPRCFDRTSGRIPARVISAQEDVPPFLSRRLSYGYAVNMRETRGARKTHHNLLLLSIIGSAYAIQDC